MQLRGFQCGQRLMVLTNFATLSLSFPPVWKSRSQPARFTFCHISSRCSKQIRPVYFCPLPPLEPGSWQRRSLLVTATHGASVLPTTLAVYQQMCWLVKWFSFPQCSPEAALSLCHRFWSELARCIFSLKSMGLFFASIEIFVGERGQRRAKVAQLD